MPGDHSQTGASLLMFLLEMMAATNKCEPLDEASGLPAVNPLTAWAAQKPRAQGLGVDSHAVGRSQAPGARGALRERALPGQPSASPGERPCARGAALVPRLEEADPASRRQPGLPSPSYSAVASETRWLVWRRPPVPARRLAAHQNCVPFLLCQHVCKCAIICSKTEINSVATEAGVAGPNCLFSENL